ncbi:MAG: class I SAM-dependent methyltransferase [Anaerolineales bacterium]|nr:class I SAM-dependent methyltransferase [Anaerolineales bacterium]
MLKRLRFSLWYYFRPPWDTGESPPELLRFIENNPAGRALDLGCGSGTNALTLGTFGWTVLGVDFAPTAIRKARQRTKQYHLPLEFRVGDVVEVSATDGNFDLVLDIGCLHGLDGIRKVKYIQNLDELLAPGGSFLLYAVLGNGGRRRIMGVETRDLDLIARSLQLITRQDGFNRETDPSAWFLFQKK